MNNRKLATKEDYDKWIRNTNILSARLLTSEVKGHFAMTSYFDHIGDHDIMKKDPIEILADCNTTACAWGHGATMPEFNDQGLAYEPERNNRGEKVWGVNFTPWCTHFEKNQSLYENVKWDGGDYDWGYYLFGCIHYLWGFTLSKSPESEIDEIEHLFGSDIERTPKKEAAVLQTHARKLEREMEKKFG